MRARICSGQRSKVPVCEITSLPGALRQHGRSTSRYSLYQKRSTGRHVDDRPDQGVIGISAETRFHIRHCQSERNGPRSGIRPCKGRTLGVKRDHRGRVGGVLQREDSELREGRRGQSGLPRERRPISTRRGGQSNRRSSISIWRCGGGRRSTDRSSGLLTSRRAEHAHDSQNKRQGCKHSPHHFDPTQHGLIITALLPVRWPSIAARISSRVASTGRSNFLSRGNSLQ